MAGARARAGSTSACTCARDRRRSAHRRTVSEKDHTHGGARYVRSPPYLAAFVGCGHHRRARHRRGDPAPVRRHRHPGSISYFPHRDRGCRGPLRPRRRCWPASRHRFHNFFFLPRSTRSPSPIRSMSRPSCCLPGSWPSSFRMSPPAPHADGDRTAQGCARSSRSMPSAASLPAPERSTTCSGPPSPDRAGALNVRVVLLSPLPESGTITVKAGYPPEDTLGDADLAAANWVWENNRSAGRGSEHAARRQAPVPADAHRPAAASASSASTATSRDRSSLPTSAACSTP